MMGYDGLLNLSHSKAFRRLTHPTGLQTEITSGFSS